MFRYIAVVLTTLLAVSCSTKVDEEIVPRGEEVTVTFDTSLPEVARTGDGAQATELHYAIYYDNRTGYSSGRTTIEGGSKKLTLKLIGGSTYDIVFWAQAPQAPYGLRWGDEQIAMNFDTTPAGNNEQRDAFIYVLKNYTVTSLSQRITLKRPFAQLNIAISDEQTSIDNGFTPRATSVKAQSYTALSLFDERGDEYGYPAGILSDVNFGWATPLTGDDATIEVEGVNYKYMSVNYLLVGANPLHTDALNIVVAFNDAADGTGTTKVAPEFSSVPVERNHRTNIVGALLTSVTNNGIVVNP